MKTALVFAALTISLVTAQAQFPADTADRRLYLLSKTWGYLKYFNQHKCGLPWDDLLNNTITEVLESRSNVEFNTALMNMFNQAGNNVPVNDHGVLPDTNLLVNTDWIIDPGFSPQVRSFLATFTTNTHPDLSTCLVRINDGTNPAASGLIDFTRDPFYLTIDYGIESHRLTVLFYYWNVINYFFPYRNIMDQPWDSTLLEFIPIFRTSKNELEFHVNFLKLVSRINDAHGTTISSVLSITFTRGLYMPIICFERAENKCVVKKIGAIEGILPGDILISINGQPVAEIEDSIAKYVSASTQASLYRDIYYSMTRGAINSEMLITLTNNQGQSYQKSLKRTVPITTWNIWKNELDTQVSYKITSCGYGYVNMGLLLQAEVPEMYEALKSAPAIIFDIRNYPNETIRKLAPFFFRSPISSAIAYLPALIPYPWNGYYLPGWYYKHNNITFSGNWTNSAPYSGKVYILVNQETQSQAEATCQYLSYHPNAKVIGTQTAGADGTVARLLLPGGINTSFTSEGWYYADGYQQQRNGVKIDSIVSPTIQGIREGKDEILLAALDCISGIDKAVVKPFLVSVYPNPATSGQVSISFTLEENSELILSLIDLTGRTILQESRICKAGDHTLLFDLDKVPPGFYLLKTQNRNESAITKLQIQ